MNAETVLAVIAERSQQILELVQVGFWSKGDFWISFVVGIAGVVLSWLAFREASQAKKAAVEAGQVVKIQSVVIDLTELGQRVNRLDPQIRFNDARYLLTETSTKIRRIVSGFNGDGDLTATVEKLLKALDSAQKALTAVRPVDAASESTAPQAVFYGIQEEFSAISNLVAELLGLFEGKNFQLVRK